MFGEERLFTEGCRKMRQITWPKRFPMVVVLLLVLSMVICPAFADGYKWSQNFNFYYSESSISDGQAVQALSCFEDSLSVFQDYGFRWYRGWPYPGPDRLPVYCYYDSVSSADSDYSFWRDTNWKWRIYIDPHDIDAKHVILHELFHTVQYSYPGVLEVFGHGYTYPNRENWVMEGQARMMQDKTFDDLDLADGGEVASYWREVSKYLSWTEKTLMDQSYKACLFWTYFTEKYGSVTTEPGYGIDALVEWWRHSSDEYGAMENMKRTLNALTDPDVPFSQVWKDFIVANYVKDLDDAPNKYKYADEAQYAATHGHGPFEGVGQDGVTYSFPKVRFDRSEVDMREGDIVQGTDRIERWAAKYYRFRPSSNVDSMRIYFVSNTNLYYHLILSRGGKWVGHMHTTGTCFDRTILTHHYDEIVMVVGGLERGSNYMYRVVPKTLTIENIWPTAESPIQVGGDPPTRDFWLRLRVADDSGVPIRGIPSADFHIAIGLPGKPKLEANILQELPDQDLEWSWNEWEMEEANYWFLIRAPTLSPTYDVSENQLYDLDVRIGSVVVTEPGALDYSTEEIEPQVEVIPSIMEYFSVLEEEEEGFKFQGKPVIIRGSVTQPAPIKGVDTYATITTPPLKTPVAVLPPEIYSIKLYDDGAHEDGAAEDGVYGNLFYKTARPGAYTVEVKAEGVDPELGYFEKEVTTAFTLAVAPDSDGDGLPDWWEERMGLDPEESDGDQGATGDPDMDDLNNVEEFVEGTRPVDSDTDSGGESDGSEVAAGRDPNNPSDDTLPSILDFDVRPSNGFNLVIYSPQPEYQTMRIWRSTNAETGYELIAQGSYPKGIFHDTIVDNWVTYYYKIAAEGPGGEMTRIEDPESATPKTDVDPPLGSVIINDGAETTTSPNVKLTIHAEPDTTDMMISNDPRFTEAQWEPYGTSKAWRLQGFGSQTVYIRFRDAANNVADATHDSILVREHVPVISILSPENLTWYPRSNVSLTFTVGEPTDWMGYSLNGQANVTITGNTTLKSLLDGSHYVVVYTNDTAGNMATSNMVYFTVDTTHPNITDVSQIPLENNVQPEDEVVVNTTVIDVVGGVERVALNYTNGNGTWVIIKMTSLSVHQNVWSAIIPSFPYGTTVTYVVIAEDDAGNTITSEELGYDTQYHVIPEFPSFLILPLFMIATLLAVVLCRRKQFR
jgi:hypothetical protein